MTVTFLNDHKSVKRIPKILLQSNFAVKNLLKVKNNELYIMFYTNFPMSLRLSQELENKWHIFSELTKAFLKLSGSLQKSEDHNTKTIDTRDGF